MRLHTAAAKNACTSISSQAFILIDTTVAEGATNTVTGAMAAAVVAPAGVVVVGAAKAMEAVGPWVAQAAASP